MPPLHKQGVVVKTSSYSYFFNTINKEIFRNSEAFASVLLGNPEKMFPLLRAQ